MVEYEDKRKSEIHDKRTIFKEYVIYRRLLLCLKLYAVIREENQCPFTHDGI
jgi:hypothetical protein